VYGLGQRAWTYPNIVVSRARGEAAFAIGVEVGRVDRVRVIIVVVPVYDQRSRLHFDDETVAGPLSWRCRRSVLPLRVCSCGWGFGVEVAWWAVQMLGQQEGNGIFVVGLIDQEEVAAVFRSQRAPGQKTLVLVETGATRQAEQQPASGGPVHLGGPRKV
jgi:hypothetical protein